MLAKILNISSGRSWCTELYNPCPGVIDGVPSSNNYQGGFGTALMNKVSLTRPLIKSGSNPVATRCITGF